MRLSAGPLPVPGILDHARPHRIQFGIAQNTPYPFIFHRAGIKAVLPKVSAGVALDVLPSREIVVQLAYALGKRKFPRRDDDEVDVIVHEVISDQGDFMSRQDPCE
jgi:hypothetical protein